MWKAKLRYNFTVLPKALCLSGENPFLFAQGFCFEEYNQD